MPLSREEIDRLLTEWGILDASGRQTRPGAMEALVVPALIALFLVTFTRRWTR